MTMIDSSPMMLFGVILVPFWIGLHLWTNTPFFLLVPSPSVLWIRLKAFLGVLKSSACPDAYPLLQGCYCMPRKALTTCLIRTLVNLAGSFTVHEFLWMLDELLWPDYRKASLDNRSIFVVGSFRTGSTSLHRNLLASSQSSTRSKNNRFISPRFVELWWPFISVQKLLDWLERRDKQNGTTFIRDLERTFQAKIGADVMARHPMHWYEAEEEDVLLAAWHLCGWYLGVALPHPEVWMKAGPQTASERSFLLYQRTLQKIMYRRGSPGSILLSKSHLIDMSPIIAQKIQGAKFVHLVRHPADAFPSWYGLTQAALERMSASLDASVATQAHRRFWQEFTQSELRFYEQQGQNKNYAVVKFEDYITNPSSVTQEILESFALGNSDEKIKYASPRTLAAKSDKHKGGKYMNPTLKELGFTREFFDEGHAEYLKTFMLGRAAPVTE